MPVTLVQNGITFSDGTTRTTDIFPSGSRVPFHQATAPTGWTQDATDLATNRMLRFVNGTGEGYGGSYDPTVNSVIPVHTHTFTTGTVSADHTHYDSHSHGVLTPYVYDRCSQSSGDGRAPYATGLNTSTNYITLGTQSANHTHSATTAGTSVGNANWSPRYTNLIVCTKN